MFRVPEIIVHCVDSHVGLLVQSQQREISTSNANLDILSSAKNTLRLLLLPLCGFGGCALGLWRLALKVPANVRVDVAEEVAVLAKNVATEVAAVLGAARVDRHVLWNHP